MLPTDQLRSRRPDGAVARLRAATRSCHDHVDAAYSVFDLADRAHYGRFLRAHAQATGAAEASLIGHPELPPWRSRMPLLADDLDQLGLVLPAALMFEALDEEAWRWGVLYVLEGSRLGAGLLVKRAGSHVPVAYLSSRHLAGEWHGLIVAIDARAETGGSAWAKGAIAGARDCFALYQRATESLAT
jgi:heme oxygenase